MDAFFIDEGLGALGNTERETTEVRIAEEHLSGGRVGGVFNDRLR